MRLRKASIRIGLTLCALTLLTGVLMFSLQRSMLFPRHAVQPLAKPGAGVEGLTRFTIQSAEGPVEGWFLPALRRSAGTPAPAVIFAHGNAELIDYLPHELRPYRQLGLHVLLPEYRGYGRSAGSPSQRAITEDMLQFHRWLTNRPDVDPERLVYHGRSLGGGAVCALAANHPPAALLLTSTFTSVRALARRFLVPGFLVHDPFDNLELMRRLRRPVLIVHGQRDQLIPFHHAQTLQQAASDATLIPDPLGEHNTCPTDHKAYWRHIEAFLRRAKVLGGSAIESQDQP